MTTGSKIYITYHGYSGDFFLTPEYSRVEYYDHVEAAWEDIPHQYRSDLRFFGFAVPSKSRDWFGSAYERVSTLYNNAELIPAKEVPNVVD